MKRIIRLFLDKFGYQLYSKKYIPKQLLHDSYSILSIKFDHVIAELILSKTDPNDFTFIQVGAFDGIEHDPLYKYLQKFNWTGILLEPQPLPYRKLADLYNNRPSLSIVNAAISDRSIKRLLYILEGDTLPNWSKGMASFSKDSILKHNYLINNIESYIKTIEIDCVTFCEIMKSSGLKNIDLLQIDTEGFDAEIIKLFPFELISPSIIHFEAKHLNKKQLEEILEFLIQKDYKVSRDGQEDMLAVKAEFS